MRKISFDKKEQKEPWYLEINPNGRIPTIVDHDNDDFAVFESGALMIYLAEKAGKLLPTRREGTLARDPVADVPDGRHRPDDGPGQRVLSATRPRSMPYAIERYQRECRRLFEVLDNQLKDHEYLAGEYSIADIANWSWVHGYKWSGVSIEGLDHLARWIDKVGARPAVKRGKDIPEPTDFDEMIRKADQAVAKAQKMLV